MSVNLNLNQSAVYSSPGSPQRGPSAMDIPGAYRSPPSSRVPRKRHTRISPGERRLRSVRKAPASPLSPSCALRILSLNQTSPGSPVRSCRSRIVATKASPETLKVNSEITEVKSVTFAHRVRKHLYQCERWSSDKLISLATDSPSDEGGGKSAWRQFRNSPLFQPERANTRVYPEGSEDLAKHAEQMRQIKGTSSHISKKESAASADGYLGVDERLMETSGGAEGEEVKQEMVGQAQESSVEWASGDVGLTALGGLNDFVGAFGLVNAYGKARRHGLGPKRNRPTNEELDRLIEKKRREEMSGNWQLDSDSDTSLIASPRCIEVVAMNQGPK